MSMTLILPQASPAEEVLCGHKEIPSAHRHCNRAGSFSKLFHIEALCSEALLVRFDECLALLFAIHGNALVSGSLPAIKRYLIDLGTLGQLLCVTSSADTSTTQVSSSLKAIPLPPCHALVSGHAQHIFIVGFLGGAASQGL